MTDIVVVGHGRFAPGLLQTARMIAGPVGTATAVEFPVGTGVDTLTKDLAHAIDTLRAARPDDARDEPVLVLTDVAGGSPSRVALGEALAGRAEVVTGANLPMLLDALFAPVTTTAGELALQVAQSARAGVRNLGVELTAHVTEQGGSA